VDDRKLLSAPIDDYSLRTSGAASGVMRGAPCRSDFEYFRLFLLLERIDPADEFVGQILHLFKRVLLVILGDAFLFLFGFELIVGLVPDLAYGHAMLFGDVADGLGQLFAPFLRERRNGQTGPRAGSGSSTDPAWRGTPSG
jgi:hypothetical protein